MNLSSQFVFILTHVADVNITVDTQRSGIMLTSHLHSMISVLKSEAFMANLSVKCPFSFLFFVAETGSDFGKLPLKSSKPSCCK